MEQPEVNRIIWQEKKFVKNDEIILKMIFTFIRE